MTADRQLASWAREALVNRKMRVPPIVLALLVLRDGQQIFVPVELG